MSTYHLDRLFAPRSVAVVGASPRATSPGLAILRNLRAAGFDGAIHLVNPRYPEIDGIRAVKSLRELITAPDLVIIAAPAATVPEAVAAAGEMEAAAAIIITAGLGHGSGSLSEASEKAARVHGLRLVGPNCLGVLSPGARLNASFAASMPRRGDLALISQSGAIAAGLVEWAARRAVGFSAVVSLGDSIDVDFSDLLDHFALDRQTRAILLYIELIKDARKFMTAARAAARVKPVVVVKSGRHALGAQAAETYTGALAGADAVYEAAFRRGGLLRVLGLEELFAAAETLGRIRPFSGNRLAILTNGGGIGVLAVDRLMDLGGNLAELSTEAMKRLDACLPPIWSRANPVDIAGDAGADRYRAALTALLDDRANDAVLAMNVPTALASATDAARAVIDVTREHRNRVVNPKPVFAVWIGQDKEAADAFDGANIPLFGNESDATHGFMHLVRYRDAIDGLMQTPPSLPADFSPDAATARSIVNRVLAEQRTWLDPIEAARLMSAYGIPVPPVAFARDAEEAAAVAAPLLAQKQAVVVKILSADIVHKSDVGGVRLNLANADAVRSATNDILTRARALRPQARIAGVTVHPMIIRPKARELIVGLADDPTFGPVVVFGRGGTGVEVINDKALALPPLDLNLARDLMARTRVSRLLKAYRDVPAVDESAVALVLVKLAQLAADVPEIREIDINPLLADSNGLIAVDARVLVAPFPAQSHGARGHPRFAIRPYPKEWERQDVLRDGMRIFIRPLRPEDEPLYGPFFDHVTHQDLRLRFFAPVKDFGHTFVARFTQIDYARAMAFIAIAEASGEMLGVVRLHANANYDTGEYAILVRSDCKGRGLGWTLMKLIIDYARAEGLRTIEGQVLNDNITMLSMCRELGFSIAPDPEDGEISIVKLAVT